MSQDLSNLKLAVEFANDQLSDEFIANGSRTEKYASLQETLTKAKEAYATAAQAVLDGATTEAEEEAPAKKKTRTPKKK